MTANENPRRDAEFETWVSYVDAYVDGTLDEKDALRLHLAAERSPRLAREIAERREFFAALDALPVAEPSSDFDRRILDQIPYERYASAPRKVEPVLVLGHALPDPLARFVHGIGRGAAAVSAAYLLVLLVSSTALQEPWTRAAAAFGDALRRAAADPEGGAMADVAGGLSGLYDALGRAATSVADTVGPAVTMMAVGLVLGGVLLALFWALSRRQPLRRDGRA